MRITAVSDMHGDLRKALEAVRRTQPDLVLSCGDWGDPGQVDRTEAHAMLAAAPVLTVYGNHDDVELLADLRNADGTRVLLAQGEVRERDGLRFAGISGIWAKSHRKPYYVTDEDVAALAERIASAHPDVLITHGCASGIADLIAGRMHGGQRCFLDALHIISPGLYLCGHLHFPQVRTLKGGLVAVNVGTASKGHYWVFEMDSHSLSFEGHSI